MYYVYILWSESRSRYYIGSTPDLERRLLDHNAGNTPSTKGGIPWIRVHQETFTSKSEALKREKQIKAWKSAESIFELINRSKN